jgi:acyl-CoA synthetase (AMP-forming)/AMP-acid ligase II
MVALESIFAHARTSPETIAVVHGGRTVSYREFAARITLARRFLSGQAIDPGRVAVLCVADILEHWIIRLALRGLGVTTVSARSTQDITQLNLGAISVVSSGYWPGLADAAVAAGWSLTRATPDVHADWTAAPAEGAMAAGVAAPGSTMLLTSGTTGLYKKVVYDAAAEARLIAENVERAGITARTVFNVLDFGGWTGAHYTWPALTWKAGGRIVIAQGPEPWRSLADPTLTHIVVTPHLLADLLARPTGAPARSDAMRIFVVGGVLSQALWREARERLTSDIWSVYGSTESCHIAYTRVETAEDLNAHRIHASDKVQVVDDDGRTARPGQVGVVRIRTGGVDGYLDDPETTRAFFHDGYFYPGDLALVREDGRFVLQGRITDVVNVLGNKLATTPIETALQDALDAEAVCVFSVPGAQGEQVHVAIQPTRTISAAELKAALQASLPPAVADVQVHSVQAFPRNYMGKIDRASLRDQLAPNAAEPG